MAESQSPTSVELGVTVEICDAFADEGITRTLAIQELTLPLALDGTDIIGQARIGMGKTLGFGVPLIDCVFDDARIPEPDGTARATIIVPTRELYMQVGEDSARVAYLTNLYVCTIYGGRPYEEQIEQLDRGVDIIVGTPGRLIDLYQRNNLELSGVKILVLDEADEMPDSGFLPDIEKILAAAPDERQTMLFSATMPGPILTPTCTLMNRLVHIRAESGEEEVTAHETTRQIAFQSHQTDKVLVTARTLQVNGRGCTTTSVRTKRGAASVAEQPGEHGFLVTAVHGDMGQSTHERSLTVFRNGDVDVLVATDVVACGIDTDDVTHVINHQVPDDEMTYVHRIGRTGRVGHSGVVVTLVGWDETIKWKAISDAFDLDMTEVPTWFSTSPELAEALSSPEGIDRKVGPARPVLSSRPSRGRGGRGPRSNRLRSHHRNRGRGRSSRWDGHSSSHRRSQVAARANSPTSLHSTATRRQDLPIALQPP